MMSIAGHKSGLINKENLTDFEIKKLQRMAAYLYDENAKQSELIRDMETNRFRNFAGDECWIWMNEGDNHLESLVCPVVIHAEDLQRILSRAASAS